jgi:hypothetical protein
MNAPVANPEPKPAYASPKPTVSAPPKRSPIWTAVEWFERIMVVAAGVLIGTVAGLFDRSVFRLDRYRLLKPPLLTSSSSSA